jgi:hypothetical protein
VLEVIDGDVQKEHIICGDNPVPHTFQSSTYMWLLAPVRRNPHDMIMTVIGKNKS